MSGEAMTAAVALPVYVERSQPATRYVDDHGPKPIWFRSGPRALIATDCCRRRRWAKYVRVQVYYDRSHRFCAVGHGCKKGQP